MFKSLFSTPNADLTVWSRSPDGSGRLQETPRPQALPAAGFLATALKGPDRNHQSVRRLLSSRLGGRAMRKPQARGDGNTRSPRPWR